jgi:hypothetical protein
MVNKRIYIVPVPLSTYIVVTSVINLSCRRHTRGLGEVSTTLSTSVLGDMLLHNFDNVKQSGIALDMDGVSFLSLDPVLSGMQAARDGKAPKSRASV